MFTTGAMILLLLIIIFCSNKPGFISQDFLWYTLSLAFIFEKFSVTFVWFSFNPFRLHQDLIEIGFRIMKYWQWNKVFFLTFITWLLHIWYLLSLSKLLSFMSVQAVRQRLLESLWDGHRMQYVTRFPKYYLSITFFRCLIWYLLLKCVTSSRNVSFTKACPWGHGIWSWWSCQFSEYSLWRSRALMVSWLNWLKIETCTKMN